MSKALVGSLGCPGSPSMAPLSSKMVVFNPYAIGFSVRKWRETFQPKIMTSLFLIPVFPHLLEMTVV